MLKYMLPPVMVKKSYLTNNILVWTEM